MNVLGEWLTAARLKFMALLKRRQLDHDLDDELAFHLAMREEKNRRAGLDPAAARETACRAVGNPASLLERCREIWMIISLETLWQDIRYGLRVFRANPTFTVVAVLSLALGIGANTAIFSLIDAILLRDLPVRNPGQLVEIMPADRNGDNRGMSLVMLEEFARRQQVFSSLLAWTERGISNLEIQNTFTRAALWGVDGNFYEGLGVSPLLGRLITSSDVNLDSGAPRQVAVLGYDFWHNQFQGDPAAVGQTIRIEGVPFEIIGITRRGFTGLRADTQLPVTIPLTALPLVSAQPIERIYDREWQTLDATARLKPGVTFQQAESDLEALWPVIRADTVPRNDSPFDRRSFLSSHLVVKSAARGFTPLHKRFVEPLYVLMGIAGLVLLIACANLASLLVSRAAARAHEINVRVALGASRWRLVRQLLIESVVLAGCGAVLGFALAQWGSHKLSEFILTEIFITPGKLNLRPDSRTLAFTAAAGLLTGLLFGLTPAFHAARGTFSSYLGGGRRTVRGRSRSGEFLVCLQIALSIVLLTSAALFVRSLAKLRSTNPGFRVAGVLDANLYPKAGGYSSLDNTAYYHQLTAQIAELPGVVSAGVSESVPPTNFDNQVSVLADTTGPGRSSLAADLERFSPGVFETLGMNLEQGRDFSWADDEHAPAVAVLSESLAKHLFPDGNALGRHITIEAQTFSPPHKIVQVIGIVNDARFRSLRERYSPELYIAGLQSYIRYGELLVRTNIDPQALTKSVRRVVDSLGHEYALTAWPLSEHVDRTLLEERLTAMFAAFFGGLALLLASIGLYGLMSYTITRRTREIGIRMALGAQRRRVLWMVLGETTALVLAGVILGLPCALAATRLIQNQLFDVSPEDPLTLLFVIGSLLAVGLLAGYLPSRRAARLDPMVALRCE